MQRKKIIFPAIIVFDYNTWQTFCGTNWQKNWPKIGSGFPRDDVKKQDDSMAGFKTRVEIFVFRLAKASYGRYLFIKKKFSAMQFASRQGIIFYRIRNWYVEKMPSMAHS